jgi:hypothetical protein
VLLPLREAPAQTFGVVGGTTFAKINVSGNEGLNAAFREKFEPVAGGFVAFDAGERFSIEPEVLWTVKGSLLNRESIHERIRLTYLEVPVLVRFAPAPDSPVRWLRMFAGPYAAYLLDASTKSRGATARIDLSDTVRSLDVGWTAGFGVHLTNIDLDARYGGGIVNIADGNGLQRLGLPSSTEGLEYRNREFTFVARIGF